MASIAQRTWQHLTCHLEEKTQQQLTLSMKIIAGLMATFIAFFLSPLWFAIGAGIMLLHTLWRCYQSRKIPCLQNKAFSERAKVCLYVLGKHLRDYAGYMLAVALGFLVWRLTGQLVTGQVAWVQRLWHDFTFTLGLGSAYLAIKSVQDDGAWPLMRAKAAKGRLIRWKLFVLGAAVCLMVNLIPPLIYCAIHAIPIIAIIPTLGPIPLLIATAQSLLLTPFQTLFEEALCRMLPYNAMHAHKKSSWIKIAGFTIITTLQFVLGHGQYMQKGFWHAFSITGFFGISAALLTHITEGSEISWGLHWMHNTLCNILAPFAIAIFHTAVSIMLASLIYNATMMLLCWAIVQIWPQLKGHQTTGVEPAPSGSLADSSTTATSPAYNPDKIAEIRAATRLGIATA